MNCKRAFLSAGLLLSILSFAFSLAITCLFASVFLIAIVFFNLFLFNLGSYFILAGFLTSVLFIMIGYVKARNEALDLNPLQVLAEMAEGIAKFDELRKSGVITEEEFDVIKARHLEKIN